MCAYSHLVTYDLWLLTHDQLESKYSGQSFVRLVIGNRLASPRVSVNCIDSGYVRIARLSYLLLTLLIATAT